MAFEKGIAGSWWGTLSAFRLPNGSDAASLGRPESRHLESYWIEESLGHAQRGATQVGFMLSMFRRGQCGKRPLIYGTSSGTNVFRCPTVQLPASWPGLQSAACASRTDS